MNRLWMPLAALAAVVAPVAINAASTAPHFVAHLAAPTSETRAIAGGVVFSCKGSVCTGSESGQRPLRVCRQLQRSVGTVENFSFGGEALDADKLAACNA